MSNFDQIGKLLCVILLIFHVSAQTPSLSSTGEASAEKGDNVRDARCRDTPSPERQAGRIKRVEDGKAPPLAETQNKQCGAHFLPHRIDTST
jgi:hypothetical protein